MEITEIFDISEALEKFLENKNSAEDKRLDKYMIKVPKEGSDVLECRQRRKSLHLPL